MQKKHFIILSAATVMFLSSCSSKLGVLSADNFTVTPNPLETQAGTVPATINGHFPEKYMNKKAVVTVVPELRYSNGQTVQGNTATFQGESVLGNDQTISCSARVSSIVVGGSTGSITGLGSSSLLLEHPTVIAIAIIRVTAAQFIFFISLAKN